MSDTSTSPIPSPAPTKTARVPPIKVEVSDAFISGIASKLCGAICQILQRELDTLHEPALIAQIKNDTTLDPKGKVMAYLDNTRRSRYLDPTEGDVYWVNVESEYVRVNLGLSPLTMKAVRDELEDKEEVIVDRISHRPLVMRHVQEP